MLMFKNVMSLMFCVFFFFALAWSISGFLVVLYGGLGLIESGGYRWFFPIMPFALIMVFSKTTFAKLVNGPKLMGWGVSLYLAYELYDLIGFFSSYGLGDWTVGREKSNLIYYYFVSFARIIGTLVVYFIIRNWIKRNCSVPNQNEQGA